jgi:Lrp/AsnC family transcriptional regulator, leucine-responsive regulatory protein
MDSVDLAILAVLEKDGRISNADLAERVGLSPSPCLRRVRRLEDGAVIRGYRALIDPAVVGRGLRVIAGVRLLRHARADVVAFESAVAQLPEVVHTHHVTGNFRLPPAGRGRRPAGLRASPWQPAGQSARCGHGDQLCHHEDTLSRHHVIKRPAAAVTSADPIGRPDAPVNTPRRAGCGRGWSGRAGPGRPVRRLRRWVGRRPVLGARRLGRWVGPSPVRRARVRPTRASVGTWSARGRPRRP